MKIPMMLASTRRRIFPRFRDLAIQARILQRVRRLRGEELQPRDPGRREDARGQVVFEDERADVSSWVSSGRARTDRPWCCRCRVGGKWSCAAASSRMTLSLVCRTYAGPPRQRRRPRRLVHRRRSTRAAVDPGFRGDPRFRAAHDDQEAARRAACSSAVRRSVSSSFSRTISPDTVWDILITVARSSCSTGAPIVLVEAGARSSSLRCG